MRTRRKGYCGRNRCVKSAVLFGVGFERVRWPWPRKNIAGSLVKVNRNVPPGRKKLSCSRSCCAGRITSLFGKRQVDVINCARIYGMGTLSR